MISISRRNTAHIRQIAQDQRRNSITLKEAPRHPITMEQRNARAHRQIELARGSGIDLIAPRTTVDRIGAITDNQPEVGVRLRRHRGHRQRNRRLDMPGRLHRKRCLPLKLPVQPPLQGQIGRSGVSL